MADKRPGQHSRAPSKLMSPGRQAIQFEGLLAATVALAVPAGHAWHESSDTVPVTSLNLPEGHGCLGPPVQK
jgi:hypothetical protein